MKRELTTVRIVLVEDNPGDVYLVERALQAKGIAFEMTWFEDGDKALKTLSEQGNQAPDLILVDLNLPKTEGVKVLGTIRGIPHLAEVPVGIITSSESPADMHRTALLGAARYIKKPTMLEDFLREVGQEVEEMLRLHHKILMQPLHKEVN